MCVWGGGVRHRRARKCIEAPTTRPVESDVSSINPYKMPNRCTEAMRRLSLSLGAESIYPFDAGQALCRYVVRFYPADI